jgi:hypothetical protein
MCLKSQLSSKTRWINVVGWNEALMDDLAKRYLDEHGCLDLHDISKQMLGGPIKRTNQQISSGSRLRYGF